MPAQSGFFVVTSGFCERVRKGTYCGKGRAYVRVLSSSVGRKSTSRSMLLASRNVRRGTLPCASKPTRNGFVEG